MSVTFERGAFERTLDEFGSLLGDLWAVDEALQRGPGDAWGSEVPVDLGRHHPFRTAISWGADVDDLTDSEPPEFGEAQAWVHATARTGSAFGDYAARQFRDAVQDLVRPVPSSFEEAVSTLRDTVVNPLSISVADDFAHLASSLGEWEGDAATQFADFFYGQVEANVRNQVFAAEAVCTGIAGAKAIVHLGQHSLMGLIVAARDSVDQQLQQRAAEHAITGPSAVDFLRLGATFFALAAAIPSGGTSLTLAAGASAAASATSTLLNYSSNYIEEGEDATFEAASAEDAWSQLEAGLADVRRRLRHHWDRLEQAMGTMRALVAEADATNLLAAPRPRLMLHDVGPGTWRHESAAT